MSRSLIAATLLITAAVVLVTEAAYVEEDGLLYIADPRGAPAQLAAHFCQSIGLHVPYDLTRDDIVLINGGLLRQRVRSCLWLNRTQVTHNMGHVYRWGISENSVSADVWASGEPDCREGEHCQACLGSKGLHDELDEMPYAPFCVADLTDAATRDKLRQNLHRLSPGDDEGVEALVKKYDSMATEASSFPTTPAIPHDHEQEIWEALEALRSNVTTVEQRLEERMKKLEKKVTKVARVQLLSAKADKAKAKAARADAKLAKAEKKVRKMVS